MMLPRRVPFIGEVPLPIDLDLAAVGYFPDQHTDLGRSDIERDDVFLFGLRHSLSPDWLIRDRCENRWLWRNRLQRAG